MSVAVPFCSSSEPPGPTHSVILELSHRTRIGQRRGCRRCRSPGRAALNSPTFSTASPESTFSVAAPEIDRSTPAFRSPSVASSAAWAALISRPVLSKVFPVKFGYIGAAGVCGPVHYSVSTFQALNASLIGLEDVLVFNAWNVDAVLNRATDASGADVTKLDWKTFDSTGLDISAAQAALNATSLGDLNAGVDLSISGAATLNVLSGLAVLKVGAFDMQLGHVSGSDGTTTLSDARAMTVTLGDVTLWVGPGGSLNDNGTATDVTDATTLSDDTVQAGDLGFSGHVDSMKLASLKDPKGNTVHRRRVVSGAGHQRTEREPGGA